MYSYEKEEMRDKSNMQKQQFYIALVGADLNVLGFRGNDFTWYNGREGGATGMGEVRPVCGKRSMEGEICSTTSVLWTFLLL